MKKAFLPLIIMTLLWQGCTSVNVVTDCTGMVEVQNSGCYLFYFIPIFSGDPEYPNQQVCRWFTNTLTLENNVKMMDVAAAEHGAKTVRNIVSYKDEEIIIGLILKRKIYHTSAEMVK